MNSIFVSLLAVATPAPAQPLATAEGAFFALSVPNAEESARWYVEKLGLKVVMSPPARDGTRMIAVGGGGLLVELIEQKGAVSLRQAAPQISHDTMVHGVFKAGVVVSDWERLIAGLKERGVPIAIGPFPASAEQRANLIIRDNNGNYIQFFSNRPAPAELGAN